MENVSASPKALIFPPLGKMGWLLIPAMLCFLLAPEALYAAAATAGTNSLDYAREDYKEAKKYLQKDHKKYAGEAIYLLTRARNDFMKKKIRSAEEEQEMIAISQSLYWSHKMKPFNVKIPASMPRIEPPRRQAEPEETVAQEEAEVREEAVEVVKKTPAQAPVAGGDGRPFGARPDAQQRALEDKKKAEAKAKKDEELLAAVEAAGAAETAPSYTLAKEYRQQHPDDLKNQFLLFGQVLEETDREDVVTDSLGVMDELRMKIQERRMLYQDLWMQEMPSIKLLMERRRFTAAKDEVDRYFASPKAGSLDEMALEYFEAFATRVYVLEECQRRLMAHNFRKQSIAIVGDLVAGFEGILIEAGDNSLSAVNATTGKQVNFTWDSVEVTGMAKAAAETVDQAKAYDVFFSAMAFKVTGQFETAYDIFGKLLRDKPEVGVISSHLQDCELLYLEVHGKPLDLLLRKVHQALSSGDRKEAQKSIFELRGKLNHPMLALYSHQIQMLKKRFNL